MQKKLLLIWLFIFTISGCNIEQGSNRNDNNYSDSKFPVIPDSKMLILSKQTISDIDAIKSETNILSFAYYTANRLTSNGYNRWYISPINGRLKGSIFSHMPVVNGNVGWGEVSKNSAFIDIYNEKIIVGDIEDNYAYRYKDWGLGIVQTNSIIQEDIELIRNSTVDIEWWFFKASNNEWYIVHRGGVIYRFSSNDGGYNWQEIDLTDLKVEFTIDNGIKKMKLIENNTRKIPKLNLHHKSETKEILKRNGCNFDDIYSNMFSFENKEEDYIKAMCQAGIMQGDIFETDKFQPFYKVDGLTVAKVLSLAYNYDEVNEMCAQPLYDNDESKCYADYAKSKGMITPSGTTIKRYEFYTYLANIFWNQSFKTDNSEFIFDNVFDGWNYLTQKGIFFNSLEDEMYSDEYGIFSDVTRWELAVLALRSSRLSKEDSSLSKAELPYSITPDNQKINDVGISEQSLETLFDDDLDNFFIEFLLTLFEEDNSEERKDTFFIPKNSLPPVVNIKETSIEDLPNIIVETAKENIGKQSPYTDGKNTIDTRLITTVYGQDVKYESAKDMCDEYEAQGKMEYGLPTDKDLKGSVVCYKDDTIGTEGKGHVAIITDSKGDNEIGVQGTKNGVMERPTDKKNIKGVIAPTDINLPDFH